MYESIHQLELISERLKNHLPAKKRLIFDQIPLEGIRGALIYGPRGVGKTTFLLDKIKERDFLYLSADHPIVSSQSLFELVKTIFSRGYEGVVIDEIHFANQWSMHLKALYDSFPQHTIWISDSSNLILKKGTFDLSRRFVPFRIPMMSFREYLYLTNDILIEPIDIFKLDKTILSRLNGINVLKLFHDYITEGIRPFFIEGQYCLRLKGILEKSIYSDIPFYVPSIQDSHLRLLNAVIGHLLTSPVPTLNISGMCSEWSVSKEKLYNLLIAMQQSEIIRIIQKQNQSHTYSKGAKIFLADPSMYYCFSGNVGSAREAFVTFALSERYNVTACKDEPDCDYIVEGKSVEIGGKSKKNKNAEFVIRDDIDIAFANKIPMWLIGMVF